MSIMSEMQGKFVDYFGTGEPVEVLSTYTRSQAIEDGVLIDVGEIANRVFHEVIIPPSEVSHCQDEKGRLWDILNVMRSEIRRGRTGQNRVDFYILVQNKPGKLQKQPLYSTCGPGDDLEPVIAIMMTDED